MECRNSSVFSYSKTAFVNYGGVVKVNGMVMGPCMVRNSGAFSPVFTFLMCSFLRMLTALPVSPI